MPDADFCSAVRLPFSPLSRKRDTEQISWGKLSHFPCTIAKSTLRTLMDTDFAVSCPLVRHGRLLFGFCPSTRTFVPCFLQTPPRGGSPCIITSPFLHQDGQRTFTSKLLSMPSTQRSRWRGGRFACYAQQAMPHCGAFNCDFCLSPILLSRAKSSDCRRKKIQFP
jgi:hypothetical protein